MSKGGGLDCRPVSSCPEPLQLRYSCRGEPVWVVDLQARSPDRQYRYLDEELLTVLSGRSVGAGVNKLPAALGQ